MTLILNGTDNSATTPAVTGTDTDTGVYYPAANQVAIATSGTQAMLANASQGVQFANAIGVGATTPSTSGAGITFPATQSASSNANTLDDYEEGTFTPTDASGAGLTFGGITSARYTKIGNKVFIDIEVNYPSTASVLTASIGGLPFPALGDANYSTGSCMNDVNQNIWPFIIPSAVSMTFYRQGAGSYAQLANSAFSNGTPYISMAYTTA